MDRLEEQPGRTAQSFGVSGLSTSCPNDLHSKPSNLAVRAGGYPHLPSARGGTARCMAGLGKDRSFRDKDPNKKGPKWDMCVCVRTSFYIPACRCVCIYICLHTVIRVRMLCPYFLPVLPRWKVQSADNQGSIRNKTYKYLGGL